MKKGSFYDKECFGYTIQLMKKVIWTHRKEKVAHHMNPIRLTETILKFDTIDEVGPCEKKCISIYFELATYCTKNLQEKRNWSIDRWMDIFSIDLSSWAFVCTKIMSIV